MDMDISDTNTSCSMMSGNSMMMPTYFNTELPFTIAFKGWMICDNAALIGSCFGVAGIAIAYEVLKMLRQYFWQSYYRKHQSNVMVKGKVCPADSAHKTAKQSKRFHFWLMHAANSMTFLLQAFLGYLLMLIVMVYNVYVVVSVIVGLSLGYFFGAAFAVSEEETYQDLPLAQIGTVDMILSNKAVCASEIKKPRAEQENKAEETVF